MEHMEKQQLYKDSLFEHDRQNYLRLYGLPKLTIEDVRASVAPNEIMIEFFRVDTSLYRLEVSDNSAI